MWFTWQSRGQCITILNSRRQKILWTYVMFGFHCIIFWPLKHIHCLRGINGDEITSLSNYRPPWPDRRHAYRHFHVIVWKIYRKIFLQRQDTLTHALSPIELNNSNNYSLLNNYSPQYQIPLNTWSSRFSHAINCLAHCTPKATKLISIVTK